LFCCCCHCVAAVRIYWWCLSSRKNGEGGRTAHMTPNNVERRQSEAKQSQEF
jgi:hypothetical protein